MTGGLAYVLRAEAIDVLNKDFVRLEEVEAAEEAWLRRSLKEHASLTRSPRAARLLSRRGSLGLMRVQPLHFQGSMENTWAPILSGLSVVDVAQPVSVPVPAATQAIHA
jgi:hypothetical protein